jgi:ATP-dependent DNA helicase RecG
MARRISVNIDESVTAISGIGPTRARYLAQLGVSTVRDLLLLQPRRYLDYRRVAQPAALHPGDQVTVSGRISSVRTRATRRRRVWLHEATLEAEDGQLLLVWFLPAADQARVPVRRGERVVAAGTVSRGPSGLQIVHPLLPSGTGTAGQIVPVYPLVAGLHQSQMRKWTALALDAATQLDDSIPRSIRCRRQLPTLADSLRGLHYPNHPAEAVQARRRLVYEELLLAVIAMERRKRMHQRRSVVPCADDGPESQSFLASLPYELTSGQREAIADIRADMQKSTVMHRLVHGDVGAGKTVVAMYAAVKAVENAKQVAFLVPTRLLAEQHYTRWQGLLSAAGVRVGLLLGDSNESQVKKRVALGQVDMVIGTHAILATEFASLGLLIVDEQQRFGVEQRASLATQWPVHSLYLSATPIPRSLALVLWQDLDVSIIPAPPAGRSTVITRWVAPERRDQLYSFLRKQVCEGRQAYMVFPRIEAEDLADDDRDGKATTGHTLSAAVAYKELASGPLAGLHVGLVHGQMPIREQERVMTAFQQGGIDVLICTTVVEVGVDVPNATVMVIEGAEMFGLAQLHQLRGRVGRGAHQSYCIAVATATSPLAAQRLKAFCNTLDGFRLAEQDLLLRGPGELLGLRQSGYGEFQFAEFPADLALMNAATEDARILLQEDPALQSPENAALQERLTARYPSCI